MRQCSVADLWVINPVAKHVVSGMNRAAFRAMWCRLAPVGLGPVKPGFRAQQGLTNPYFVRLQELSFYMDAIPKVHLQANTLIFARKDEYHAYQQTDHDDSHRRGYGSARPANAGK
jgi:hypothetical protein